MTLVDLRGRHADPDVRRLLDADAGWILIGWEEDDRLVACAGVERDGAEIAIRALSVAADRRRRGIGRALVDAIAGVATADRLVVDDSGDATEFLLACGFSVADGGAKYVRPITAQPSATATRALTLRDVEEAIVASWGADTSDDPEWSEANPALGQCAATAAVVQELLGGEIVTANVARGRRRVDRHAWNRLASGLELDLTRSQYRDGEQLEEARTDVPLLIDRRKARLLSERVRARLRT